LGGRGAQGKSFEGASIEECKEFSGGVRVRITRANTRHGVWGDFEKGMSVVGSSSLDLEMESKEGVDAGM